MQTSFSLTLLSTHFSILHVASQPPTTIQFLPFPSINSFSTHLSSHLFIQTYKSFEERDIQNLNIMTTANIFNDQLFGQQAPQWPSQTASGFQPQYPSSLTSQLMGQPQQQQPQPKTQAASLGPASTAQAAAAIAAYLNGQASIVYDTNRTAQYYRSVAAIGEDSTSPMLSSVGPLSNYPNEIVMIQAKAIEALLTQTNKGARIHRDLYSDVSSASIAQPPQQSLWQGAQPESWPLGSQVTGSRKFSIQSDNSGSAFSPTSSLGLPQPAYASPPVLMDDHGSSASSSSASSITGSPLTSQMDFQASYLLTDSDLKSFTDLTYECNDIDLSELDNWGASNTVQPSSSLHANAIAPDAPDAWATFPQANSIYTESSGAASASPQTVASSPDVASPPSVSDNTKNVATRVAYEMIPWNIEVTAQDPKKRHVCVICKRGFARAFNLKSHMLTHDPSRPKPFACDHKGCGRSFSRAHDLDRHRQGIHSEGSIVSKYVRGPTSAVVDPMSASKTKKRSSRGVSSA